MNNTYWEEYAEYWEKRLNTNQESQDKTPTDEIVNDFLDMLMLFLGKEQEKKVLDFGCGFCRMYDYFRTAYGGGYYGTDIAQRPLDKAVRINAELDNQLKLTDGETIPWNDSFFDGIFCWGVFDCTEQDKILYEFIRTLKQGGCALFTSKVMNYCEDDELAYIAEIKAEQNGFPNHFTNYEKMKEQLIERKVEIVREIFWKYRKDYGEDLYRFTKKPECFYEYCLIIRKTEDTVLKPFDQICDKHSCIYYSRQK